MKRLPILFVFFFGALCTTPAQVSAPRSGSAAQPPEGTPAPKLLDQRLTGSGMCRVHFDAKGCVASVAITKSTGSPLLDNNTLAAARRDWHGLPNLTASVPIKYLDAPLMAATGAPMEYRTPVPDYPDAAKPVNAQGRGVVQVAFDLQGNAVYAGIVKSFGSKILDDHTVAFAKENWKSSGGEDSMITLPVAYVLTKPGHESDSDLAASQRVKFLRAY